LLSLSLSLSLSRCKGPIFRSLQKANPIVRLATTNIGFFQNIIFDVPWLAAVAIEQKRVFRLNSPFLVAKCSGRRCQS